MAGSHSLAVLHGSEYALKVSAGLFLLVILVSLLPFLFGWLDLLYALPLGLMNLVILYSTFKLLDARQANRRKYIRYIYLSGLLAFTIFIVIRLVPSF
jgi:geranylgeranylglycerol-phosphate geranylgeranyltransferase